MSVAPAPADISTITKTESGKTSAHEVAAGDVKVLDSAMSRRAKTRVQAMKSKLAQLRGSAEALAGHFRRWFDIDGS